MFEDDEIPTESGVGEAVVSGDKQTEAATEPPQDEPAAEATSQETKPPEAKPRVQESKPDGLDLTQDVDLREDKIEEPEPEVEETEETYRFLDMELDHIEEFKHDDFYGNLEPKHIEKMDPYSRRILHNVRIEMGRMKQAFEKKKTRLETDLQRKEAELDAKERALLRDRQKLLSWTQSPEFKKAMEVKTDDELPSADTPEGIIERAKNEAKAEVAGGFKAMQESYEKAAKLAEYKEYTSQRPEFKDPAFKKKVAGIITERREAGKPVSLDDAYQLARYEILLSEKQQKQAEILRAQQQSASKIQQRTSSGSKPEPTEVPVEVRQKGGAAVAEYLMKNRKVVDSVNSRRR